jgi:hypothetical protein
MLYSRATCGDPESVAKAASEKLGCNAGLSKSSRRHKIGHEIVQVTINIQKVIQRQSSQ